MNEVTQALRHSNATRVEESIAANVALLNGVRDDVVDTEKKAGEVSFGATWDNELEKAFEAFKGWNEFEPSSLARAFVRLAFKSSRGQ